VLHTQQGSGTYIAPVQVERDEVERRRQGEQLVDEFLARAAAAGLPPEEVLVELAARVREPKP
jgi:DNA-binding transcriptional regulator YhcF (GntR family)